jgi:transitional endoplasmic reticulum ATPase
MPKRPQLRMVPLGDAEEFGDLATLEDSISLRELLRRAPALSLDPLNEADMTRPVRDFVMTRSVAAADTPLYRPPGMTTSGSPAADDDKVEASDDTTTGSPAADTPTSDDDADVVVPESPHPESLRDEQAVVLAYGPEIESVASFLRAGLSVLVLCDKLVVENLWRRMAAQARKTAVLLEVPDDDAGGLMPRSLRQRQIEALKQKTRDLKDGDVLVIAHLDLLAGGSDSNLPGEAREMIELLYAASDRLLLAFADRALALSEVLASRFAVRLEISGLPRAVRYPDGREALLGDALLTRAESRHFKDFDASSLYKNIAGMNPVRLRQAILYAVKERPAGEPVAQLYQAIRAFKAQTSASFEIPDVSFDDIGGYGRVKNELHRALKLIQASFTDLDPRLQRELIPRGFIFHGPPGTGKTLFAKAIANQLNATIQVISGPEVTDMYVGESERKVREIFAEARRNAPAVLVFDEFDSIAGQRSGRDDGGSRAGNAIVAQILTEMDGFRPDVPMLVIGTTNRVDIIDEALMRPSRFQPISIDLPDDVARRAIAAVHAKHFEVPASAALLDVVAAATDGFNGDEIRSLFRDALVGMKCEDPPIPADARRLGNLVGRIRAGHEDRAALSTKRRETTTVRRGERPAPSGAMVEMTPTTATVESDTQ